ncbi:MAG: TolC family outer membrane protein [Hydrogenophilus sp.]|nr:TolC family outer membrane protein [Hydrogenophilus sp.]
MKQLREKRGEEKSAGEKRDCSPRRRWREVGVLVATMGWVGGAWGLDLATAFRLAEANDPGFAASQRRAEADAAAVEVARARLLPAVSASASVGRAWTNTEYLSGLNRGRQIENEYASRNWGVVARQPLYRPSEWAGWERSKAQAEGSRLLVKAARVRLLQQVARAYAQALSADAQVAVARQDVERFSALLRQAQRALAAGAATRTDVEEAQARLDLARATVVNQEGKRAQALAALAALIGEEVQAEQLTPLTAMEPLATEALSVPLVQWVQRAQSSHPEVAALVQLEEAAREMVKQQRAQHWPVVDLVASRRLSRNDSETTIGQEYLTTSAVVQLSVPLYAGGGVDAAVRSALAALEEAQLRTEGKRRELAQAVTQAYTALQFGYTQWQALAQAERSAEQAVIGTEKGIAAGTRNSADLLNAQQELARVRAARVDAFYQTLTAAIDLRVAAEGGVEEVLEVLQRSNSPSTARSR